MIGSQPVRVDAHHHVYDLAVRDQPWTAPLPALRRSFGLAELRPHLAAHDIAATVVVQTVTDAGETPELLALAAGDELVAGVVGWVDLRACDVTDRLAELTAGAGGDKLVGIRHQVQEELDPWWLSRADVRQGLAAVAAAGLAYDLIVTASQLPATIDAVRALPQLRFVLDHGGKPRIAAGEIEPWRSQVAELAQLPNVAVKLSGLITEADHREWTVDDLRPYADSLVDAFGPDRVMFGSDWPVCLLAASYDDVLAATEELIAGLTPDERAAVFGEVAVRTYRLGRA
jgi:L-fuconolactonase